jgi:hypothetical protein
MSEFFTITAVPQTVEDSIGLAELSEILAKVTARILILFTPF